MLVSGEMLSHSDNRPALLAVRVQSGEGGKDMRFSALLIALAAAISLAACSGQGMPGPALLDAWGETGEGPGELFQPTGIAVSTTCCLRCAFSPAKEERT